MDVALDMLTLKYLSRNANGVTKRMDLEFTEVWAGPLSLGGQVVSYGKKWLFHI